MSRSELLEKGIVALSDGVLLLTVVYGIQHFFLKKAPLYFRILTLAAACYTNSAIFRMLYYLCYRENLQGMGITFLGSFGCYLFLFSANFGQYDSLIDDRSAQYGKYRLLALAAPAVLLPLIVIYTFGNAENTTAFSNGITFFGYLPAVPASYYNFKHFIIPDMGFSFVRWVRRANLCALFIEFADILCAFLYAFGIGWAGALTALMISLAFLWMLMLAVKGRKSWLQ